MGIALNVDHSEVQVALNQLRTKMVKFHPPEANVARQLTAFFTDASVGCRGIGRLAGDILLSQLRPVEGMLEPKTRELDASGVASFFLTIHDRDHVDLCPQLLFDGRDATVALTARCGLLNLP